MGELRNCDLCGDEDIRIDAGLLCDSESGHEHFFCTECMSHGIATDCQVGGRFGNEVTAIIGDFDSVPGELPCPMFPHECDCHAIDASKIMRCVAESADARKAYALAQIKIAENQRDAERKAIEALQLDKSQRQGETALDHLRRTCSVSNSFVFSSLEILNLYWDSLPFRGGSNFSLRINWKCKVDIDVVDGIDTRRLYAH